MKTTPPIRITYVYKQFSNMKAVEFHFGTMSVDQVCNLLLQRGQYGHTVHFQGEQS